MSDEPTITTLHSVASTLNRMMIDRGYTMQEQLDTYTIIYNNEENTIATVILIPENPDSQDGIDPFKQIVKMMEVNDVHHTVIASYRGFTPQVVPSRENIREKNYIEVFKYHEIMSPVVDHVSVPLHEKINDEERADLLLKLGIREGTEQYILPNIKIWDPVVRYYDFNVGDILRITRRLDEPYYRIVTMGQVYSVKKLKSKD